MERRCQRVEIVLFPRSRPVGVKTESTAEEGVVQSGGGSFLAAAHADTEFVSSCIQVFIDAVMTHVMPVLHHQ